VLILTGSAADHTTWRDRLIRNCSAFHCLLKYVNESKNFFTFCGIEFFAQNRLCYRRTELERFRLQHRLTPRCAPAAIAGMIQLLLRQGRSVASTRDIRAYPGPALPSSLTHRNSAT
jgi:hypothetical protein